MEQSQKKKSSIFKFLLEIQKKTDFLEEEVA